MTTTSPRRTHRETLAHLKALKEPTVTAPSARQIEMLRRAAETHPVYGVIGFGPLGVDLRTYDALLRKGWIIEVPVSRGHGLGGGTLAQITDAGREALGRIS